MTDVGPYPAPTFVDIDGDGDLDVMSGYRNGNTYFFKNTGSATAPAFAPNVGFRSDSKTCGATVTQRLCSWMSMATGSRRVHW